MPPDDADLSSHKAHNHQVIGDIMTVFKFIMEESGGYQAHEDIAWGYAFQEQNHRRRRHYSMLYSLGNTVFAIHIGRNCFEHGSFVRKQFELDCRSGEIAIPFPYDEPAEQAQFSSGHAVVSIGGGIDLSMRLITEENEAVSFPQGMEAYVTTLNGRKE